MNKFDQINKIKKGKYVIIHLRLNLWIGGKEEKNHVEF